MDDEVKSAFELAMERISALPQLTPQEMAEQKEKENAPVGRAIAVKYLNGALSVEDLPAELSRYGEDRQQSIRRALLAVLCREMRFGNPLRRQQKHCGALRPLSPGKGISVNRPHPVSNGSSKNSSRLNRKCPRNWRLWRGNG